MRLLAFIVLFTTSSLLAQEFQVRQYHVANGLPSDVIKAVAQDTLGFFWIATDDGLVKFDGNKFTPYKHALHSQYAKGFLLTRSGRLLHYGDLDLIEIQNQVDTVIFKTIRLGARNPTDSMLWFPKSIYEDRGGNIWLGEPQSVVRISNNTLTRYNFPLNERSPQFLRSFSFFEDQHGDLFTVSFFGTVYKLHEPSGSFQKMEWRGPTDVNAVTVIRDELWVASRDGIFTAVLLETGGFGKLNLAFPIADANDIKPYNEKLIITTSANRHFLVNKVANSMEIIPQVVNNLNSAYVSTENDIWLSSTDGLILLQKNLFKRTEGEIAFVECIAEDKSGNVYYATMLNLYKLSESSLTTLPEIVLNIPRGYFQSILINQKGIWVSNGFSLFLLQGRRIVRQWNLEEEGRFIQDLFEDREGNIWLSQSGNQHAVQIDKNFNIKRYLISLSKESTINVIREGPDGIYLLANGLESSIFLKRKGTETFENLKPIINFQYSGDFNLTDIAFTAGISWLASSEGLLRLKENQIDQVQLGEQTTGVSVKNIKRLSDNQLLFSTSFGLIRYQINSGDYWVYDESTGLPSNTITSRGLFVDESNHVWVGTSKGLSYSLEPIATSHETRTPHVVEARVNGIVSKFADGLVVPYGSFVELSISSITFPEANILYQYRDEGIDTVWQNIERAQATLTGLSTGLHAITLRARKSGGFAWSQQNRIAIRVLKPFWQEFWFVAFVLISVSIIAWTAFAIASRINKRRRSQLQDIINQRTHELRQINDELTIRNTELDRFVYSASHDLSAPLKSLLGLVYVARKEGPDATMTSYLSMMEQSIVKLEDFIRDVTNYSRNARMEVVYKSLDLKSIVASVLNDLQYAPGFETIEFKVDIELANPIITDEMRIKIIFNNLISNAIKFRSTNPDRQAIVKIGARLVDATYTLTVTDNGRGIPEDQIKKVFNMFYRGTDSVPGSGLGLYILQEAVNKLSGTVKLESELGKGSTFKILIPEVKK